MDEPYKGTELAASLVAAYRETLYEVEGDHPMVLRVGERSEPMSRLMEAGGHVGAVYVTACNPFSQPLGDAENGALQEELKEALAGEGRTFIEGQGRHPSGGWAPEASLLVLGLQRDEAAALGRRWRQNAVLWIGRETIPELLLLR
ncbi:MAG: hypothetical protein ACJA2W_001417 [Planctomycetota bacterium]|jgi:hypothetical protein